MAYIIQLDGEEIDHAENTRTEWEFWNPSMGHWVPVRDEHAAIRNSKYFGHGLTRSRPVTTGDWVEARHDGVTS